MGVSPVTSSRKAVFLDRDGVVNKAVVRDGKPYPPASSQDLEVLPGVSDAINALKRQHFSVYIVTNQPDVARGQQTRTAVELIHSALRSKLQIDDIYVCYHDDSDGCQCRKPKPGLLLTAAANHGISLVESYMIGDRWRDIDCGRAANCTTIYVERGYQEQLREQPHFRVPDLTVAAEIILSLEKGQS